MPRPAHSELWQRLRAARDLARKSREDVAGILGVHPTLVDRWESAEAAARAQPTAQQVMRIAKLCGLPAYLLVDDAVSIEDITSFTGL